MFEPEQKCRQHWIDRNAEGRLTIRIFGHVLDVLC